MTIGLTAFKCIIAKGLKILLNFLTAKPVNEYFKKSTNFVHVLFPKHRRAQVLCPVLDHFVVYVSLLLLFIF